jgi:hypothetical protein
MKRLPWRTGHLIRQGAWSAALTAVGLDVKHNQKHSRDQNKQQAGHKAEVVGFHG